MAVVNLTMAGKPAESSKTASTSTGVYASAVALALVSFFLMLLIIPPMFWHARNRNIGATALVAWLIMLLLFTFTNAIIWPSDDIPSWFSGTGYCDVQIKLQVAAQVAVPASFACILRALAAVMDTDRAIFVQTKAQKQWSGIVDLICCVGFPLLQMLLHYVVQSRRYYVYGISGCAPAASTSWPSIPIMILHPLLWTILDVYFAVLIIIRLYQYRLSFNAILASRNTNKSRFLRLYLICTIWILGSLPVQCYNMSVNAARLGRKAYSWSYVHRAEAWNELVMVPSHGAILYDRWIWLASALVVFIFFGFGRDAISTYRTALVALGLGRVFPSLKSGPRAATPASTSSFSSKAKMLFKRKSSASSFTSGSRGASAVEPLSPKSRTFLDTIDEAETADEKANNANPQASQAAFKKKGRQWSPASLLTSFSALLQFGKAGQRQTPPAAPPNLSLQQSSVLSTISSAVRSDSMSQQVRSISPDEMVVRTEVRQASEVGL
ncbi:a-factor receptor [Saxophila tyrrhenica]|uniref:A-factor receptor n=1 Tax=Saxophila tyrrhenica TaxID=1690608 RepID=A0AAV9P4P4_9PEZI|nr:a-factor receptor [Saxophila tyrrhenica]